MYLLLDRAGVDGRRVTRSLPEALQHHHVSESDVQVIDVQEIHGRLPEPPSSHSPISARKAVFALLAKMDALHSR